MCDSPKSRIGEEIYTIYSSGDRCLNYMDNKYGWSVGIDEEDEAYAKRNIRDSIFERTDPEDMKRMALIFKKRLVERKPDVLWIYSEYEKKFGSQRVSI